MTLSLVRRLATMGIVSLLVACGGGGGGGGDAPNGGAGSNTGTGGGPTTTPPASTPKLLSIWLVSAQADALAPGTRTRYVARGNYSDKSEPIISSKAIWHSSNLSVATVQAEGEFGYVDALQPGQVDITATLDGVSQTVTVVVLPIKALEYETIDAGFNATAITVDGQGRVHASVAHHFSGPLFSTPALENLWSFTAADGWSPKLRANAAVNDGNPNSPVLASNNQGHAVLAWTGNTGVFVSTFAPGLGWEPAKAIAAGATVFQSFGFSLRASVDANGNAMVVWVDPPTNGVLSSRYDVLTSTWSSPQPVPGGEGFQSGSGVRYAANPAGDAVMVRERWNVSGNWETWASRYTLATGWGPPHLLRSEKIYTGPDVAISSAGAVFVVGANILEGVVYSARYEPGSGWTPSETIATTDQPVPAKIAVNSAGQAVATWGSGYDGSIYARRFTPSSGWEPATQLSAGGPGTPELLTPFIAADGRIFAAWNPGSAFVAFRKFYSSSGWGPRGILNTGFKGAVTDVTLAFNSDGVGAVIWAESYTRANSEGFEIPYIDYYTDPSISFSP